MEQIGTLFRIVEPIKQTKTVCTRCGISIRGERDYWLHEILHNVQIGYPKATLKMVLGRVNSMLRPCDAIALREFHHTIGHTLRDTHNVYQNYSHAFFARTKVSKVLPPWAVL